MELKGSKTEKNLQAAFAGESQAHTKYGYYASVAKKAGYEQISAYFDETSHNEREHAKIWFKLLHDGMLDLDGALKDAADGENWENTEMYPEFAKVAREEGFDKIAFLFDHVGKLKNTMKNVIAISWLTLKAVLLLNALKNVHGFVVTAVSSWKQKKPRKYVPFVRIRKRFSNFWFRITKRYKKARLLNSLAFFMSIFPTASV